MNKKYKIYCYTNIINNKKYIGQTSKTLEERAGIEGYYYRNSKLPKDSNDQPMFYKAIQKYGWNNFMPSIIEDNLSLEEANKREQYWIAYYHTWIEDPKCWGYNMQPGGDNHTMTEATKQKISQSMKGKNNPFYGKHHTPKTIEKIKQNLPNQEGENNPFYGKHHTLESKEKISLSKQGQGNKKIYCLTTQEFFNSLKEAGEKYNIATSNISQNCHKQRKSAGKHPITNQKMIWCFAEEVEQ